MGKGTWPNAWASGLAADLPAAADVGAGAYYLATDSGVLSQSDGVSAWTTIYTMPSSSSGVAEDLTTAETDDTLVLAPDGAGGVEFRAEAGGSALTVKDEGSNLDTAVTSIDFVGAGVVATNTSHAVTVTISGGGGGGGAAIGAKAYSATTQSISASTLTAVTFASEEFDTDGFHNTGSNTSRMTVPAGLGGKYLLTAGTKWVTGSPSFCEVAFRLNGSTIIRGGNATVSNTNNGFFSMATTVVDLAAGDYVEFMVYQTTGTLSIGDGSGNHDAESNFSILRLDSGSGATTAVVPYAIDGGGAVIATGSKGFVEVPFACTITAVRLLADVSGSITITIKKASYSGFPTLSSIVASAKPTLSSAQKSQDTTLTGWTTAIAAGDILEFVVDTVSTVTRVLVSLTVTRT